MGSGCEILIAAILPSSARQLPILAALHARASTLFGHIIHHGEQKVNTFLKIIDKILSKRKAFHNLYVIARSRQRRRRGNLLAVSTDSPHCTGRSPRPVGPRDDIQDTMGFLFISTLRWILIFPAGAANR